MHVVNAKNGRLESYNTGDVSLEKESTMIIIM